MATTTEVSSYLHCYRNIQDIANDAWTEDILVCGEHPTITAETPYSRVRYIYEVTSKMEVDESTNSPQSMIQQQLPLLENSLFSGLKDQLLLDDLVCCYDEQQSDGQRRRRVRRRILEKVPGALAFSIQPLPGELDQVQPQCEGDMNGGGTSSIDYDEECASVIGSMNVFYAEGEDQDLGDDMIKGAVERTMSHGSISLNYITQVNYVGLRKVEEPQPQHEVLNPFRLGSPSEVLAYIERKADELQGMGIFMVAASVLLTVLLIVACVWRRRYASRKGMEESSHGDAVHEGNELAFEAKVYSDSNRVKDSGLQDAYLNPSMSRETAALSSASEITKSFSICHSKDQNDVEIELDMPPSQNGRS